MGQVGASSDGALVIRFEGRTWTIRPGETRIAGRGAHIDLGDEPAMHRKVAAFAAVGGCWFVLNLMKEPKRITVGGRDEGGVAPRLVPSQEEGELPPGRVRLSFRVGVDLRALDVDVPARDLVTGEFASIGAGTPTSTESFKIELSPARRLLAVALAELRLMDPNTSSPLPTEAAIVSRLGWTSKQYAKHLDELCKKLMNAGVKGVVGDENAKALRRREIAVDVLLENNVIGFHDLALLPAD